MNQEAAIHFRNELRDARAKAFQDAEAFDQVIFVVERLGSYLTSTVGTLEQYKKRLCEEASRSPLADDIPNQLPAWHASFGTLYSLVQLARNDALHQGAFARHLTTHSVEVSVILEDALMADATCARDFMVSNPVCAHTWEPISSIRRTMLVNAFSYLPVATQNNGGQSMWHLVSDFEIACYLRGCADSTERRRRLSAHLDDAVRTKELELIPATTCNPGDDIPRVLAISTGLPVLVLEPHPSGELRGLITPFDVL